jgi:hypothetical protein
MAATDFGLNGMSASRVRRRRFPAGARPARPNAPAGSNRSSHGVTKWLKTKGAETDMPTLTPPRHISTLPTLVISSCRAVKRPQPDHRVPRRSFQGPPST